CVWAPPLSPLSLSRLHRVPCEWEIQPKQGGPAGDHRRGSAFAAARIRHLPATGRPVGPAGAPSPFPSFFLWLFSATCVSPAVYLPHPCCTVFQRGEGQLDLRCRPPSHYRRTAICASLGTGRPDALLREVLLPLLTPPGNADAPPRRQELLERPPDRPAALRSPLRDPPVQPAIVPHAQTPLTSWGQHCLRLDPPSPSAAVVQHRLYPDPTQTNDLPAGGAFGGNRGLRPVPPEKGVFPLDHQHECDLEKKEYLACLKSSGHNSEKCREFSKKYLQCRMEKNLMARQDLSELGFGRDSDGQNSKEKNARDLSHDKE
ncbi:hypothetical protein Taro_016824, partial [Colocasia esculenta]|nr:hypothetical protein [Colocasia esculenta]